MSVQGEPPAGFRIKGWHVLAAVTGFFVLVIGVDGYFASLAFRTFPGEVSNTPYEDGLAYNRRLAQLAQQSRLGWRAAAAVAPDGSVLVQMRDRRGAPVSGLRGGAKLERPATEMGRIQLEFVEQAPGDYGARAGRLTGTWDLSAVLQDAEGRRFEAERRLTWP
jgi:nitrogen fixation protein FixH